MTDPWPQARLGNVGRLRALAAGFPGSAYAERVIPASFDEVWGYFSDMERSVPSFDETVTEFRIVSRTAAGLTARARGPGLPIRFTLDVDLERGWCLMTARPVYYLVAFAAEPSGDQTRFAHAEACNVCGPKLVRDAARPFLKMARRWIAGHVERDIDGLEAALGMPQSG
jgi:hypothetical protein